MTTTATLKPSTLAHLLAGEATVLGELKSLLGREQHALTTINAEELEDIAPTKSELLDAVAEAVWARDSLFAAHGYAAGDEGLRAANADDPRIGDTCGPLWTEISRLVGECHELNRANGAMLHQLASQTSSMIASLLGDHAPTSPYGSS